MSTGHIILCVITLTLLGLGIYDYAANFEGNGCSMTYMFRMPQFLPVPGMKDEVLAAFPRYSLYYYTEGGKPQKTSTLQLSGIPVLFIPGNGGSYRQVRSLGSVSLMKSEKSDYHFDYFAVDLNGEKNALYGGFLFEQTEYVHQCIQHILDLYEDSPTSPSSVVVAGHSMGGLIARALFTLPEFDPLLVNTIITQATPHHPVLRVDQLLDNFYWHVNRFWQDNQESLNHVTFLSTGGGHRDVLVKASATGLEGLVAPNRHVSTISMSVPHVWLAADHQCNVWCKELVLATTRALFDMIDPKTGLMTVNADKRMDIFRFHFSDHSGGKNYHRQKESVIKFAEKKDLVFKVTTKSKLHIPSTNNDKLAYHLFPIPSPNHGFVATTKIPSARWVFLCSKATDATCEEGIDVTSRGRVAPPFKAGVREIHLSPKELDGFQFVVIRVPSGSAGVINAEMYDVEDRHQPVELPAFFSMEPMFIANISDQSYMSFTIDGFTSASKAYIAELVPVGCAFGAHKRINSTLRFEVPWKQEDTFSVAPATSLNSLSLKLQSGRPLHDNESSPSLSVYMDPRCQYTLTLQYSHKEGYGQVIRFYGQTIPTMLSVIVILAVAFQLKHLYTEKPLESISKLQELYCKPYIVVPPIALFRALVKHEGLEQSYDFHILDKQGIFFPFLPLVMFLLCYGLCAVILFIIESVPDILGRLWAWVNTGELSISEFQSSKSQGYRVWPFAMIGGLMALAVGTCGANALIILCILTLFKVAGLRARVLVAEPAELQADSNAADGEPSGITPKWKRVLQRATNSYHFASTILVLLIFLLVFTLPSFIAWFENLRFDYNLRNDPSLYPALLASVSVLDLLGNPAPIPKKSIWMRPFSWMMHFSSILMVLYAIESVYRCAYFISGTLLLICFLQLV